MPLAKFCHACGYKFPQLNNVPGLKFCPSCGTKVFNPNKVVKDIKKEVEVKKNYHHLLLKMYLNLFVVHQIILNHH